MLVTPREYLWHSKYRSCCPSSIASARYRLCSSHRNARSRIFAVLLPNMLRLSEKIDCEHKVNTNFSKGWTPSIQACLHFSPRQEARASTGDWPLTRRRSIHLRREACFSLKPQAPSSAPPPGASSLLQGCPKTIRPSLRYRRFCSQRFSPNAAFHSPFPKQYMHTWPSPKLGLIPYHFSK